VHAALDQARESGMGETKIGTTGRGIGPAYEDKIARRALRVQDLLDRDLFSAKLKALLEYHNFTLVHYHKQAPVPFEAMRDETMAFATELAPMVADVAALIHRGRERGDSLVFEGAQGALLDIDHGTYPYVTSSNCLAGAAAPGAGIGPQLLDYVLGIVKAYTTRVGTGPFPTELTDDVGAGLAKRGNEFGSVTGRPRRCGWLDVPALRRSFELNGVDGICITKLDVLDGMPALKICVGYTMDGKRVDLIPTGADAVARCVPIYETMPGWQTSTFGAKTYAALPSNARAYLERIEQLTKVRIGIISTGPDREETIVQQHPFG
jgi:adenylosuccinate synthase